MEMWRFSWKSSPYSPGEVLLTGVAIQEASRYDELQSVHLSRNSNLANSSLPQSTLRNITHCSLAGESW